MSSLEEEGEKVSRRIFEKGQKRKKAILPDDLFT